MNTVQTDVNKTMMEQLTNTYGNEDRARRLLGRLRWPSGEICPHCRNAGEKRISPWTAREGSPHGVRPGVYFCGACRRQFTVTAGTILEGSHVPIAKWLMAFFLLCSPKKSLSANQLHRMIGGGLQHGLVHVPSAAVGHDTPT